MTAITFKDKKYPADAPLIIENGVADSISLDGCENVIIRNMKEGTLVVLCIVAILAIALRANRLMYDMNERLAAINDNLISQLETCQLS